MVNLKKENLNKTTQPYVDAILVSLKAFQNNTTYQELFGIQDFLIENSGEEYVIKPKEDNKFCSFNIYLQEGEFSSQIEMKVELLVNYDQVSPPKYEPYADFIEYRLFDSPKEAVDSIEEQIIELLADYPDDIEISSPKYNYKRNSKMSIQDKINQRRQQIAEQALKDQKNAHIKKQYIVRWFQAYADEAVKVLEEFQKIEDYVVMFGNQKPDVNVAIDGISVAGFQGSEGDPDFHIFLGFKEYPHPEKNLVNFELLIAHSVPKNSKISNSDIIVNNDYVLSDPENIQKYIEDTLVEFIAEHSFEYEVPNIGMKG